MATVATAARSPLRMATCKIKLDGPQSATASCCQCRILIASASLNTIPDGYIESCCRKLEHCLIESAYNAGYEQHILRHAAPGNEIKRIQDGQTARKE